MAKVTGPLLSTSASGSIGPRLTYSKRASGAQVRIQRAQKDYENEARVKQRTRFFMAKEWWLDLSTAEKTEWEIIANEQ